MKQIMNSDLWTTALDKSNDFTTTVFSIQATVYVIHYSLISWLRYTAVVVLARSFGMRAKSKPRSKIEAGQCRYYIGTAATMEDEETLDIV